MSRTSLKPLTNRLIKIFTISIVPKKPKWNIILKRLDSFEYHETQNNNHRARHKLPKKDFT